MAFWGIEVKPGKPYTHSTSKDGSSTGRLRISQATLAIGTATLKSLVQCNVGDKRPVLLCALLPNKTESLQLDLEFDEAEDVMFSVIGPRGVYLTGYYVGQNRRSNLQDDSESFGEDIANSETMESNHNTDEDEYDDSFINDDEPEPLTPSPVSSSREDDDEEDIIHKKRNGNGGRKRLKKRYQSIESDEEMSIPEIDDEDDFPISSICKNNKSQGLEKKTKKETTVKVDKETKNNDDLDSKEKIVVDLVNDETTGKGDQQNTCVPALAEVVPESKPKTKKKKRDATKEESTIDVLAAHDDKKSNKETSTVTKDGDDKYKSDAVNSRVLRSKHKADIELVDGEIKADQPAMSVLSLAEVVPESKSKKKKKKQSSKEKKGSDALTTKDEQKPNDTGADHVLEVLDSAEVVPEKKSKPKKRKAGSEVNNLLAGNKQEDDQPPIDNSSGNDCEQLANGDQSNEKKGKRKKRKTSTTQEVDKTNMDIKKENNKPSGTEPERKNENSGSYNKKTLSNGLVIEDLETGDNSKGKVAAAGKKVRVQYVVKLKENGQVIDSNGKSPHKLKLGDKDVIEGLNVGLDGMRVGDKRRITIPPSMSLGYKGTGENVPPNSWLIYDVEMTSIH